MLELALVFVTLLPIRLPESRGAVRHSLPAFMNAGADDDLALERLVFAREKPAFALLHEFSERLDIAGLERAESGVLLFDEIQPFDIVAGYCVVRERDIAGRGAIILRRRITAAIAKPAAFGGIVSH